MSLEDKIEDKEFVRECKELASVTLWNEDFTAQKEEDYHKRAKGIIYNSIRRGFHYTEQYVQALVKEEQIELMKERGYL